MISIIIIVMAISIISTSIAIIISLSWVVNHYCYYCCISGSHRACAPAGVAYEGNLLC